MMSLLILVELRGTGLSRQELNRVRAEMHHWHKKAKTFSQD